MESTPSFDRVQSGSDLSGLRLSSASDGPKRRQPKTEDRNAESFWAQQVDVERVTIVKAEFSTGGRRMIAEYLKEKYGVAIMEQRVRQYSSTFFCDTTEKADFMSTTGCIGYLHVICDFSE